MPSSFSEFYTSLLELINEFEKKNVMLRVEKNSDFDLVRVLGENITSLSRASAGLDDVSELAYTAAEHHPYWGLLYHSSQISKIVLEKWNGQLDSEETSEINWLIDELKNDCEKLKEESEKTDG